MRPIDAALSYAARGWAVFPCHTINSGNCSCHAVDCSSPGKHPRIAGGLLAASMNLAQVTKWWERSPASNIGVRTGVESGLVVLDIDPRHGGSRSIKALIDAHGDLSTVPRVRTGSGGWHLVFAHPGEPVRNSAGRLGPGLDIRGDGGYVIAPPSMHSRGREYRWEVDPTQLPPMPDWLRQAATRPFAVVRSSTIATGPAIGDGSNWALAALDAEIRLVRTATAGSRNMTLNRSAFCLGQIVGAGMLEQHLVERLLVESGIGVGLGEREAIMTVRSGLRAGLAHPRRPTSKRPDDARRDRGVDVAP